MFWIDRAGRYHRVVNAKDPAEPNPADVLDPESTGPEREAHQAVMFGVWFSALRCIAVYLVAPLLGAFGVDVLGPSATVVQVLAAFVTLYGAINLWRLNHAWKIWYALLTALVVFPLAIFGVWEQFLR